ncbi:MAG: hypothetical protein QM820_38875 [Minicystis sp.]
MLGLTRLGLRRGDPLRDSLPPPPESKVGAVQSARGAAPLVRTAPSPRAPLPAGPADQAAPRAIAEQAEANRRSVVEARETGRFPERLNPSIPPKPFDRAAFEANPRAYLDVVEPGRVWQTADGAPSVKALEAVGVAYREVAPGGSVVLEVTGEPRAPVTFTSFDMGAFENGLPSITVVGDTNGVSRAVFTATPGTVLAVNILAGSPLAVGNVKFVVMASGG